MKARRASPDSSFVLFEYTHFHEANVSTYLPIGTNRPNTISDGENACKENGSIGLPVGRSRPPTTYSTVERTIR